MTDGRHEIGPHGLLGPLAPPYRLQCAGEDLGRQVVGRVGVPAAAPCVTSHRAGVPSEEFLVRQVVAVPHLPDQIGVGECGAGGIGGAGAAALPLHGHRDVGLGAGIDRCRPRARQDGAALGVTARPPGSGLTRYLPGGQPTGLRGTAHDGDVVERLFLLPVTAHRGSPRMRCRTRTSGKSATWRNHDGPSAPATTHPGPFSECEY